MSLREICVGGSRPIVAIVGGGFSGAAVALHLSRSGSEADIVVFEPRARLGGGLAYGGDDPIHRVNVPATRMSMLPEDPDHFARWLEASGVLANDPEAYAGGQAYPRRREFRGYAEGTLRPHVMAGHVRHVRAPVVSLQARATDFQVRAADGTALTAAVAVIATTHPPCSPPPPLRAMIGDPGVIFDPLADNVVRGIGSDERVLIVGAGLTSADLVAALDAQGHRGLITMISRRGLRARGRSMPAPTPQGDFLMNPACTATALLRRIRATVRACEAQGTNWEAVIECVRNQGQEIWRALTPDARHRVVRRLRPFWDVHRFRAAPQIEAVVAARLKRGAIEMKRARLGGVERVGVGYAVALHDSRRGVSWTQTFERIVIAVGPTHRDIFAAQPFLADLAEAGAVVLDPTELGLWTSREGQALGVDGVANPSLFIAGPLARGTFGELMGLPQVSEYAEFVARNVATVLIRANRREQARA